MGLKFKVPVPFPVIQRRICPKNLIIDDLSVKNRLVRVVVVEFINQVLVLHLRIVPVHLLVSDLQFLDYFDL